MSAMWLVKETPGITEVPIVAFDNFWDADDYVSKHPGLHVEPWDGFVPVLTNEDLDAYAARPDRPGGKDPREGFNEWELPQVLMFLSWAAELKAMTETQNISHFGYERLCYAYGDVADSIQY